MKSLNDTTVAVGRVLLSLIFVNSGWSKIGGFAGTAEAMAVEGVPAASAALVAAIVLELGGGLMVLLGLWARLGALLLVAFTLLATIFFHDFWNMPEAEQRLQTIMFMKNLSIIGGLLLVVVHGAGRFSLQQLVNRRV